MCVPLVDIQSFRKAWVALRWARRCVMEKPALPSSWDRITSTCLQKGDKRGWRSRGKPARQVVPLSAAPLGLELGRGEQCA